MNKEMTATACACGSTSWRVSVWSQGEDETTICFDPDTGTYELDGDPCLHSTWGVTVTCEECGEEVSPGLYEVMLGQCPAMEAF